MSKFLLITKINLLQSFNGIVNNSSKYKSERRKKTIKGIIVSLIVVYILFYVYYITSSLMPTFVKSGNPIYVLAFLFAVCSLYIFFANAFKIKNILFDFKDYNLLMSLPIRRNVVIASKLSSLYIINLLCTFIVMIPGYLAYIKYASLPSNIIFFLLLLAIPLIPLLLSSIVGIVITWLTSFFKNNNIGSYIVYILIIAIVFFGMYKINGLDNNVIVNNSINMVNYFSKYYPLTSLFTELLGNFNIISMLIYLFIPLFAIIIFILFINYGYDKLRNKLLKQNVNSNYMLKKYVVNNSVISLYKKELKKYFTSPLYVINTSFGCIIMILLIISILIFNDNMISHFENISNFNEMVKENIFIILSVLFAVSSTTNSSISLEGKSLWIIKMLPVSTSKIFASKIMVNLTVLLPTAIIVCTFFGIYLKLSLVNFIFTYLISFAYSIFTSVLGLLLNLLFPKFDYDNEVRVIKQSLAVFLSILIGIISVLLPFKVFKGNTDSIILITSIIFLIDIILLIVLHFYGDRKFRRL